MTIEIWDFASHFEISVFLISSSDIWSLCYCKIFSKKWFSFLWYNILYLEEFYYLVESTCAIGKAGMESKE
jgi:hypothetical protein